MKQKKSPRPHRKCPCGSRKKYRNCCGKKAETVEFSQLPAATQEIFRKLVAEINIAEQHHNQYFGEVPPIVSCVFNGRRMVCVGSKLVHADDSDYDWEAPSDFLLSYLKI